MLIESISTDNYSLKIYFNIEIDSLKTLIADIANIVPSVALNSTIQYDRSITMWSIYLQWYASEGEDQVSHTQSYVLSPAAIQSAAYTKQTSGINWIVRDAIEKIQKTLPIPEPEVVPTEEEPVIDETPSSSAEVVDCPIEEI